MKQRHWWKAQIESAWKTRSIVWLSGVRRSGKTVLCQSLANIEYFDCELPSVRRRLEDPEQFLAGLERKRIVLDEVQRLQDPSSILKIAADHYPDVHIVATGSSTLQATTKFRDTLTGRKTDLWLTPMIGPDLVEFGQGDIDHRLLNGGLPPFFLAERPSASDYEEWISSFWARDIQELFRLERRWSFMRFLEMIHVQSGGLFEATRFAAPCEVSRTTIANYLDVMEATRVAHVVRPFSTNATAEITSAPKVYGFDTGFISHLRGWDALRSEDRGILWEHLVLNEIQARTQRQAVCYWRDKRGHEVDLVIPTRAGAVHAIECKSSSNALDLDGIKAFRKRHPDGENWLVAMDIVSPYDRSFGDLRISYIGLEQLGERVEGLSNR